MKSQKAEVSRQKGRPKAGEVENEKSKGRSKKAKDLFSIPLLNSLVF